MPAIRQVLCPLDLSETASTAFDYATTIARWYDAQVTVLEMVWVGVPTVPPASAPLVLTNALLKDFSSELQQFVDERHVKGVNVATLVREGPVVAGILEQARAITADLIVMGTHGRTGFDRFVLGSVAEKILQKASCPVLTVPPKHATTIGSAQGFQNILCPIDFSPSSLRALEFALSLAQESGKRLVLLHVFDGPTDRPMTPGLGPEMSAERRRREEAALTELRAAVPADARNWCDITELTSIGRPHEEIVRVAATQRADLIVMGVHGRGTVELALFGSTTNQVVRRATCPVLTVRP